MNSKNSKSIIKRIFPLGLIDKINRTQFGYKGLGITFIVSLITFIIWFSHRIGGFFQIYLFIAKSTALIGICLLSLTIILSLRLSLLESLFGGLDKVYKAHHLVGQISFVVILLHPLFLIIRVFPNLNSIAFYLVPGLSIPITYGIVSFYLLIILLLLTLIIKLPYKVWHLSHKFMGIVLILAIWHAIVAGRDLIQYPILGAWIIIFSLIGILSYFYMLFLYQLIGPKFDAEIKEVKDMGYITEIKFKIIKKKMNFHPGQFVFVKFTSLGKSFEIFPFSISSSTSENIIRISAKKSGDFTSYHLPKVNVGDKVLLYGPYGKFSEKFLFENKDMIWIAGGIGVTPFLSMLKHKDISNKNKIYFLWSCKDEKDVIYDEEIKEIVNNTTNINYRLWLSNDLGRISTKNIIELFEINEGLSDMIVFICGPNQMMMELADQFIKIGVKPRNIVFEDFNLI
ncbi:MAG: Sulfhydrogenase 2 subunit gamma [Candidatus Methanofastidiosum methylothiophilum]|uniref:Sulfhydrogenase 2 subunit gamma n=1 Tax=Candidatus Methanofastidiosum methylothiophilum TaxID=1705564 RepID=A0A150IQP5_9EURY|nr:MAG: Sulfhydrogenase 2 subunit gamma [Candidatus Methanofastidiosum methylthiophilus]KYC47303.1 MAG: Sulfhydrogenase 2 subunit gamma [Candidatus Methanofastidiosum methylthiophilus]KYC49740.1 MAG: Sulfhydrogenase 2 subunit gamma [Candidatus Methanofastidiosum methylthiophilus]